MYTDFRLEQGCARRTGGWSRLGRFYHGGCEGDATRRNQEARGCPSETGQGMFHRVSSSVLKLSVACLSVMPGEQAHRPDVQRRGEGRTRRRVSNEADPAGASRSCQESWGRHFSISSQLFGPRYSKHGSRASSRGRAIALAARRFKAVQRSECTSPQAQAQLYRR